MLVHDYELMLLPAMIRGRFPDAPVGFFCHCPFRTASCIQVVASTASPPAGSPRRSTTACSPRANNCCEVLSVPT